MKLSLSWQQLNALSTLSLNNNVTRVDLVEGTTGNRTTKSLYAAVWLRGKQGAQRIYQLPKRSTSPRRVRDPIKIKGLK